MAHEAPEQTGVLRGCGGALCGHQGSVWEGEKVSHMTVLDTLSCTSDNGQGGEVRFLP